jgi:hypothetical protein
MIKVMSKRIDMNCMYRPRAKMQCPLAYRPLFKAVAKNYPVCGFLSTQYAQSGEFGVLLQGRMNLAVKKHVQESFPVLHAVVSDKQWDMIPDCFLAMVRVLAIKAAAPAAASEVASPFMNVVCKRHI